MSIQTTYLLKIDGINGDVTIKPFAGWIEIETLWFPKSTNNNGYGIGMGKFDLGQINMIMPDNSVTWIIAQSSASGKRYTEAILVGRRNNTEFLRFTLKGVTISSIQTGMSVKGLAYHNIQLESESQIINHGAMVVPESRKGP